VPLVVITALPAKNLLGSVLIVLQTTSLIGKMIKSASFLPATKLDLSVTKLFAWKKLTIKHKLLPPSPLMLQVLTGEPFQLYGEFKIRVTVVAATLSVQS